MLSSTERRLIAEHIARHGVTRIPEGLMATRYDQPPTPRERFAAWIEGRKRADRLRRAEERAE